MSESLEPHSMPDSVFAELCRKDIREEGRHLWRAHHKATMIASALVSPISAFLIGFLFHRLWGFTVPWTSVGVGLLAAALTIPIVMLIVCCYLRLFVAPRSLYKKTRRDLLSTESSLNNERATNAKPLIAGKITEVIMEKTISKDQPPFDYYFTVKLSLTSERANTNFPFFEFTLFAENTKNGPAHKGERVSLDGLCLERKQPPTYEKLKNYESEKLLTQWETRPGWLRFVVRGVQWDLEKIAPEFTQIQIVVTDGSSQSWSLDSTPPWAETNYNLKIQHCNQRVWVGV